jgi:hypothetical protein
VRISALLTERNDLPDLHAMQRLFEIVKPRSPWPQALHDKFDPDRPFRAFGSAVRWAMNIGRAPQPSSKHDLSYWHDCCRNWLRARNCIASDLDANVLVLACLATGVSYSWVMAESEPFGSWALPSMAVRLLRLMHGGES